MSDVFKLQYNGMTLAYPGWNGYVGWENAAIPFQRYEKVLFETPNGVGTNAGTYSDDFRNFDEIGICQCWQDSRAIFGANWVFYSLKQAFNNDTGTVPITFRIANDNNYWTFINLISYDNINKTFSLANNQSTQYWGIITPVNNNATITATNNTARHKVIAKIIGVKYQ